MMAKMTGFSAKEMVEMVDSGTITLASPECLEGLCCG